MLTFYRTADDPAGQEVQDALRELCMAHEVVVVTASGPSQGNAPEGTQPPALVDEGEVYQGQSAILARLEELNAFRELWYKYGADACYCDQEGGIE